MEGMTTMHDSSAHMPASRRASALVRGALAVLVLGAGVPGLAREGRAQAVTEVKVERAKPEKEKAPTLQFLKENIGFIRARYDRVREKPVPARGEAETVDPRFLAYQQMLLGILASQDSTAGARDEQQRRDLLQSITQLGDLERELDMLERLLDEQRARLGVLQDDFAGHQQTALIVVLSGYPGEAPLSEVSIATDDGATLTVPLTVEQRETLQRGGVVQVFHRFVEPREQVIEVGLRGDRWPGGDSGYVTLEPARERITLLRLDLSAVRPDQGATSIQASTWLHEARTPPRHG